MQEFLPNTYPAGRRQPVPACPLGLRLPHVARQLERHAGQLQLRRRLRNGSHRRRPSTRSRPRPTTRRRFTGASSSGAASRRTGWISTRSMRRRPSISVTCSRRRSSTRPASAWPAARCSTDSGARWSRDGRSPVQLTTGSGLPLTPTYLTSVPGTGVTGTIRADLTGAPEDDRAGRLLSESGGIRRAGAGSWGNAGRELGHGPAAVLVERRHLRGRFPCGDRLNLDWRIDASNVLNRVTFAGDRTRSSGARSSGCRNRRTRCEGCRPRCGWGSDLEDTWLTTQMQTRTIRRRERLCRDPYAVADRQLLARPASRYGAAHLCAGTAPRPPRAGAAHVPHRHAADRPERSR